MEQALPELTIDNNNDMEPEDDFFFFLIDGDDFVAESSDEAMLDEPVYLFAKKVWKVFVYQIVPLFNMATFCCHENTTFN